MAPTTSERNSIPAATPSGNAPGTSRTQTVLVVCAVVLAVIGGASLLGVLGMSLAGVAPSAFLTFTTMITLPVAFVLMVLVFIGLIRDRRRA